MKRLLSVLAVAALVACGDTTEPTELSSPSDPAPQLAISDAAHGGEPHFYFLPPIVPEAMYTGTFDGTLSPIVEICAFTGGTCGEIVARYTLNPTPPDKPLYLRLLPEKYAASWKAPSTGAFPATFRIRVLIGTREFGYADVIVVRNAKELQGIDRAEYVGMTRGSTLPIAFRFEQGIVGSVTVAPPTATIDVGDTQTFTATLLDLHGDPVTCPTTLAWSSGDPDVATTTNAGVATGVAPGTVVITAACGTVTGTASLEVLPGELTWTIMPSGTTKDLFGVSGVSPSDVFISGQQPGTILKYDGTSWAPMTSPLFGELWAIWAVAANDVYIVGPYGGVLHYDGTTWGVMPNVTGVDNYAVWAASATDVFIGGPGGRLGHYDGATWTLMASPTTHYIGGLWGTGGDDVFAVGDQGQVLRYDGTAWTIIRAYGSGASLQDVYGFAADDVFAVGFNGTILHYDGTSWTPMTSGTTNRLDDVWGTSPTDVYAVGVGGTILHYDGTGWSPLTSGVTNTLTNIWGSSADDIFVTGYGGMILHGTR